ncbi:MAG: cation diffusion facilitator family transporter, partial [Hyphomicrobiaceae bacterium]
MANTEDERATITRIALGSIVVAVLAMAIKYVAYIVTGSVALYSDALEGIINVITGILTYLAIRISARPPDRHHQFGHHKAEYFSAIIEGFLIVVAAALIIREAWEALFNPRSMSAPLLGLAIAAGATALNAGWAQFVIRWGTRNRSPALVADGHHVMTDVITSIGVVAGLAVSWLTGLAVLDPLIAIVVAVNILWMGWRLISSSFSSLMDEAAPREVQALIRETIRANGDGAIEVHDLRTRDAGAVTFIEFHLVVPGTMTVRKAHDICDRLEAGIEAAVQGASVL